VLTLHLLELGGVFVILIRMVHHILSLLRLNIIVLGLEFSVVHLVDALQVLLMLDLHDGDVHLERLNLVHEPLALEDLALMLLVVALRLHQDFLRGLNDGRLQVVPLVLRLLNVGLVGVAVVADVAERIDLLIEGEESRLHSLDLDVSVAESEL
jgi:hypothetical protein